MTIRHIVAWKLAATDADQRIEHATGITTRLLALDGVVPSIRTISSGADVLGGENWDVAIVADFDDVDGLHEYIEHPAHQEVVAYVRSVVSSRVAVDFEL
ncbi:hypothetical protein GCM10027058_08980 [Microbacterium neimengense]